MGTRGVYGFRKNGVDKLTYNHFDSYPDWLGEKVIEFLEGKSISRLHEIFDQIEMVDESGHATAEQVEECKQWLDVGVSSGDPHEWYCLLRKAQGDLSVYDKGLKYMADSSGFILNSLFCEFGYIINLDTEELEFWVGFQKKPCEDNRYGTELFHGYYPCKLVKSYDLLDVVSGEGTGMKEGIVADMEKAADEVYQAEEDYQED